MARSEAGPGAGASAGPGTKQSDELLIERRGRAMLVKLNRPDQLNALTASLLDLLRSTWAELAGDPELRCVIITGSGRGFCAGADMEMLKSDRSATPLKVTDELAFLPGHQLEIPIITAVNGPCAGGGLHFVADADIVIASERATFSDPHVFAGQVTALEPLTLVLRMRPDVLRRMVLLGREGRLDAAHALAAGLVTEVVDEDLLLARALELAEIISRASPAAVRSSLRVLRDFEHRLLDEPMQAGWEAIRAHWIHPDSKEGPAAFLDRREPDWE